MLPTAVKTATTTGSPVVFIVIALVIAFVAFIVIRNKVQARNGGGPEEIRVEGRVVASRIQARIRGVHGIGDGGIVLGAGKSVGYVREDGTAFSAGSGIGVGSDGVQSQISARVNRNFTKGLNLLPHIPITDVEYDVLLSVEYTDPDTGAVRLVKAPVDDARAAKYLPEECHILASVTNTEVIDPHAIAEGFSAVKAAMEEAKHVKAAGGDFGKHMLEVSNTDQTGFVFLTSPIPVTLTIKDRNGYENRVWVEFQP